MSGIVVFKGIGIGKCQLIKDDPIQISDELILPEKIAEEIARYEYAKAKVIVQLNALKDHTLLTVGEKEAMIFDAHLMMIDDPMLVDATTDKIRQRETAEASVTSARNELVAMFSQIEDPYIRERARDIEDVSDSLVKTLLGIDTINLSLLSEPAIIVARDLKPSETVMLNDQVKGIILETGSVTSHAAIVAKAKGIPTIIGYAGICSIVQSGDIIVLDARKNQVLINPDEESFAVYQERMNCELQEKIRLSSLKDLEAITLDGHKIKLYGNVGSLQDTLLVKSQGGRGVGLMRTEFLYMDNSHFPTEEEQFDQYHRIAQAAGEEVIIRTLDIGGDKTLPYFTFPEESNPFLGFRAIRFCLENPAIFKTQLRAILRASHYGKVKIMFPMIATMQEFRAGKVMVREVQSELRSEGIPFDEKIEIGIMLEIPAAVLITDLLAKEVDFFSIGTNDLCQYTLAVDRMNSHVSHLYQPLNPSIIRLIDIAVKGAHSCGREIGICGEMASDEIAALVLIGLGVDELSISPSMIPLIKEKIRSVYMKDLQEWVEPIKHLDSQDDIVASLERSLEHVNC
ncbi:MAG: phosphoenolpyruvate--protein phosphotransferase [Eubacteriales bacterium]